MNRFLKVISESDKALVRETDEIALLDEICRIIVDIGGYSLAWAGFPEYDEKKTVRPAAASGAMPVTYPQTDQPWLATATRTLAP